MRVGKGSVTRWCASVVPLPVQLHAGKESAWGPIALCIVDHSEEIGKERMHRL